MIDSLKITIGYSKEIRRRFIKRIITYAKKLQTELSESVDSKTNCTELDISEHYLTFINWLYIIINNNFVMKCFNNGFTHCLTHQNLHNIKQVIHTRYEMFNI